MDEKQQDLEREASTAKHRAAMPVDPNTVAWIQRELAKFHTEQLGLMRLLTRTANELTAAEGRIRELAEANQALHGELMELRATMGEHGARVTAAESRIEKMSQWAKLQSQTRPSETR